MPEGYHIKKYIPFNYTIYVKGMYFLRYTVGNHLNNFFGAKRPININPSQRKNLGITVNQTIMIHKC